MDEVELTEEQSALIDFIWGFDFRVPWNVTELFHYRSGSSVEKMASKEGLILRLTEVNHFEDKLEGRAIGVYYESALKEMLDSNELTSGQYDDLIQIEPPEQAMIWQKTDSGIDLFRWEAFNTYIACFSTKKDDPYMYEHYVRNKKSGGFCLEFAEVELDTLPQIGRKNAATIRLIPVMYAGQVVEYIKEQIKRLIGKPSLYKSRDDVIDEILHNLQFSAKRDKYSKEKEIRLVVFLRKNDFDDHLDIYRDKKEGEIEIDHINLRIPKHMLMNVTGDPNNDLGSTEKMRECIRNQGYRLFD